MSPVDASFRRRNSEPFRVILVRVGAAALHLFINAKKIKIGRDNIRIHPEFPYSDFVDNDNQWLHNINDVWETIALFLNVSSGLATMLRPEKNDCKS